LVLEARAGRLLAEVGDVFSYSIFVTNPGTEPLADIVVVDTVPAELTVFAVPLPDAVDAVQVGSHRGKEDIVWVLRPIDPGETVELTWRALAWDPGDLRAVNKVSALVDSSSLQQQGGPPSATASSTTYLGGDRAEGTKNPPYRRVEKRTVTVAATTQTTEPLGAPGVLPATGIDPLPYLWSAAAAIAAGLLLVAISGSSRARRVAIATIATILMAAGCTTEETPPQARSATPPPLEVPRPDSPRDSVLGLRIERPNFEPRTDAPTETPAESFAPETPVVTEPVQTIETVVVTAGDLPAEELDSRDGDNAMTYTWDEASLTITEAASSAFFEAGAQAEILGELDVSDDGIAIDVIIANKLADRRLHVAGRIVHRIFDSAGALVATLESAPIDVMLSPGGSTAVEFEYLLPSGSYSVSSDFEAS
jgi:uncharacterized repeat protein (TIGR01451 family)